jgi:hypothetical protein
LGSNPFEEVKKAKEESRKLSQSKLISLFIGLSLFFNARTDDAVGFTTSWHSSHPKHSIT